MTPAQDLGEVIRQRRIELCMNQIDIARAVGISRGTISLIEAGKVGSPWDLISAILVVLDLEMQITPCEGWKQRRLSVLASDHPQRLRRFAEAQFGE